MSEGARAAGSLCCCGHPPPPRHTGAAPAIWLLQIVPLRTPACELCVGVCLHPPRGPRGNGLLFPVTGSDAPGTASRAPPWLPRPTLHQQRVRVPTAPRLTRAWPRVWVSVTTAPSACVLTCMSAAFVEGLFTRLAAISRPSFHVDVNVTASSCNT